MTKPVIAVDIDDVLAGTTELLRVFINERSGSSLTKEDYLVEGDYWGYYGRVWESHGIGGRELFEEFAQELIRDQAHVPLLPGAHFAMYELSKRFHVIMITSRKDTWEPATRKWFRDHFSKDDIELYFTGHHQADDFKSKGEICKELNVELLIDDNYDHCKSAVDLGIKAILFGSYGWTKQGEHNIPNCKDWPAVLEYIDNAA
ncbi:MAG: hypothetical protein JWN75_1018 [Candidatus Saccharibacteria bacterium]|nr:hypothetical protein [Candidatus Saccharibacteria bacterium]